MQVKFLERLSYPCPLKPSVIIQLSITTWTNQMRRWRCLSPKTEAFPFAVHISILKTWALRWWHDRQVVTICHGWNAHGVSLSWAHIWPCQYYYWVFWFHHFLVSAKGNGLVDAAVNVICPVVQWSSWCYLGVEVEGMVMSGDSDSGFVTGIWNQDLNKKEVQEFKVPWIAFCSWPCQAAILKNINHSNHCHAV